MREINFYSQEHLGDNLNTFHYCRKVLKENPDIIFNYFLNPPTDLYNHASEYKNFDTFYNELKKHVEDLERFNLIKNFINLPSNAINIHINAHQTGRLFFKFFNYTDNHPYLDTSKTMDEFFVYFFATLSELIGVDNPIKTGRDMLFDNPLILNNNILSDSYDFFIINAKACSGQITGDLSEFNMLFDYLIDRNYKVISINKYKNIPSTIENNLSLLDVGNISLKCKYIIGVSTAPMLYTFNIWNIDEVKLWIMFLNHNLTYSFNNRILTYTGLEYIPQIIELLKQNQL